MNPQTTDHPASQDYEAKIRAAATKPGRSLVFIGVTAVGYVQSQGNAFRGVVMRDPGVEFVSGDFRGKGAAEGWVMEEFWREPDEPNSHDRFYSGIDGASS